MKHSDHQGFTLIELMIAMAIGSILMVAVVSAYQIQVGSKNTQEALTDMNSSTRAALEIMVHELRTAGCDPDGTANAGIVNAAANTISFTMDIGDAAGTSFEPDGALNGPNEQVRYAITAAGDLGRDTGGGLQPLARNVDALDFVYLDEDGNVTGTLANPRSVQITIVARAGRGGPGFMKTAVDNTNYTNQQGTVVLAAPGDQFRRVLLTTTVACRNLGV
ncbi:MAG: prepilin-type N-terminal cleavage/methylation domain-containing protein [Desulfosarcina sp.]|jgi:type IV pilus assembly protein PilW